MSTARYIVGDTRDVTATIPDNSIDLILTSPPFLALRSYLPADHPDKHREIGSEPTPAAFIDMLLELTAEWGRVLAPHGSICVELGDTYSGSSEGAVKHPTDAGKRYDNHNPAITAYGSATVTRVRGQTTPGGTGWPLAKSKALIPELYRIALAYGLNPLTGAPSPAGQWRVRNVVTWCRPNPPVGALGDKYRPATSDLVCFTKASNRWFDLDSVRTAHQHGDSTARGSYSHGQPGGTRRAGGDDIHGESVRDISLNPAGAPPLDYWTIPPTGYTGSHYAVYPPELCRIPILSMCPRHVCTTCGEPRRRIVGDAEYVDRRGESPTSTWTTGMDGVRAMNKPVDTGGMSRVAETLGWTDCGHNAYRRGLVFDPFAGSGTTLMVATGNDRDAIGIDIDERNAHLAVERLGMFVTIEHHPQQVPA